MKTINVTDWTHKELWQIKLDKGYSSIDELIKDLLKRKGGKK